MFSRAARPSSITRRIRSLSSGVGFFIATSQQDNDLFEVRIDGHEEDAEPLEHEHDLAQLAFLSPAPHRRIVAVHARSSKMADRALSARAAERRRAAMAPVPRTSACRCDSTGP